MINVENNVMEENNDVGKPTTTEILPDHVQPSSDLQNWLWTVAGILKHMKKPW